MSKETTSGTPDPQDSSAAEDSDKGSLDALLAHVREFEAATSKQSTPKNADKDELSRLRSQVESLTQKEADRAYRNEMDSFLVPTVSGETQAHPKLVEQWLNEQAETDSNLRELWDNRGRNRKAFEDAVKELAPKFSAYAEKEGIANTAGPKQPDRKLAAAIRSSRSTQQEPRDVGAVDVGSLSDSDFVLHKQEVFRLARQGQLQ